MSLLNRLQAMLWRTCMLPIASLLLRQPERRRRDACRRIGSPDASRPVRGLLLVNTVSNRWNWYTPPQDGGKVVWTLLETP